MNPFQCDDLSQPLLPSSSNDEKNNSQVFVLNHEQHPTVRPSREDSHKSSITRDTTDEKMREIIYSFSTLILSIAATSVFLFIDCHPRIEIECFLLFVLSLSHVGYLFEVTQNPVIIAFSEPIGMYFHQSNRLIVNAMLLILFVLSSSKVDEEIQFLYWLIVLLLSLEITSVINGLLFDSSNAFLSAFLLYLQVLCGITLFYDIFRFHEELGVEVTAVSIFCILSQIIPFLGNWRRKRDRFAFHCLLIGATFYLDYSLYHQSYCHEG